MDPLGVALQLWRHQHHCGRFYTSPKNISQPDARFASRVPDEDHVDTLMKSFIKVATVNQNITVVIIDDALWEYLKANDLVAVNKHTVFTTSIATHLGPKSAGAVLHTIEGDHSRVALVKLNAKFRTNSKYKKILVNVLVCPDDGDTERFLTVLGNADNMKPTKKPDFDEWVMGMHRRCDHKRDIDGELDPEYAAMVKKDMGYATQLDSNTIGQIWQLAKRTGAYWDVLEKMLRNDFAKGPCKNKAPKSASHFTKLAGLADNVVVDLLSQVQRNEITWASMEMMVLVAKMELRCKMEGAIVLADLNKVPSPAASQKKNKKKSAKKRKSQARHLDIAMWVGHWESVVVPQSESLGGSFIHDFAKSFRTIKQKEDLPESFRSAVVSRWTADHKRTRNQKMAQSAASNAVQSAAPNTYVYIL
jgi:hypothetical protein